jgi:hypothetical protein
MEMSQGNSLYNNPKQTKMSFYFLFQNGRTGGQNMFCLGGLVPVERGRVWGKGVGVWIQWKYCVHMYVNGEMIPVETIPWMEGIKENDEEG